MSRTMKNLGKLAFAVLFFTVLGISKVQAQDKYTYFKFFDQQNYNAIYFVVSDPVKNWYNLSNNEKDDFKANFKTSANRQTGETFITNTSQFIPQGEYASSSKAKEAIQDAITKFKSDVKGSDKPLKVIYINPNKY